jgi:hypothetical protein
MLIYYSRFFKRHNVCVRQDLEETPYKVASALMNALMSHVLMERNASIKKEVTFVNVHMECRVIHTRADVSTKIQITENSNASTTTIVLQIFSVMKNLALAHAQIYFAERMRSVNPKIMPAGVDAKLDLLRTRKANVSHVSVFLKVLTHFTKLMNGVNLLKTPPIVFDKLISLSVINRFVFEVKLFL